MSVLREDLSISIDVNIETIEELSRNGYQLIQRKNGYRFGEDTVLLADYIARHIRGLPHEAKCIDLGANCGASTFLLHARCPHYLITSVEVQDAPFNVLKRNINLNNVSDQVTPLFADIRHLKMDKIIMGSQYDLVFSNPPYFSPTSGLMSDKAESEEVNCSRFEINGTLSDFVAAAAYALKPSGVFAMVYRVSRIAEAFAIMKEKKIAPICLRFVHPTIDKPSLHFLVAGRKGLFSSQLQVLSPLILRRSDGQYSDEYLNIYGKLHE